MGSNDLATASRRQFLAGMALVAVGIGASLVAVKRWFRLIPPKHHPAFDAGVMGHHDGVFLYKNMPNEESVERCY
jgi:hypothetical protein